MSTSDRSSASPDAGDAVPAPRAASRRKRLRDDPRLRVSWWLSGALAVAALLLTPIVYYVLGQLLLAHQPGYSEEGDGFRIAIVAFYTAPFAAIAWGLAGAFVLRPGDGLARRLALTVLAYVAFGCLLQWVISLE